jgi:hypothetical protein
LIIELFYRFTLEGLSDDNRREILLLLKHKNMGPTKVAEHFNFTLPVSCLSSCAERGRSNHRKKRGKNRFYYLNRNKSLELIKFLEEMYDYNMSSLEEYVENKEKKRKKKNSF